MSTPEPLWRAMAAASVQAVFDPMNGDQPVINCRIAAELRTIADEITKRWSHLYLDDSLKEVISWLRAEADKAEAGQ
jgi:hypothetical protein